MALFVAPMGRDARFGHFVHFNGSNLYLHPPPRRRHHRGVKRLVHVGFGPGDVILEFVVDGLPQGMYVAQRRVAFGASFHNDSKGDDVINLFKLQILGLHLFGDAVNMFVSPQNRAFYVFPGHGIGDLFLDLFNETVPLPFVHVQQVFDFSIFIRIKKHVRPVFQLLFDPVYSQPGGQGSENIQGFPRYFFLFMLLLKLQGAHVVEPVGQFDQYDADVLCHGQKHISYVFGLARLQAFKFQLA